MSSTPEKKDVQPEETDAQLQEKDAQPQEDGKTLDKDDEDMEEKEKEMQDGNLQEDGEKDALENDSEKKDEGNHDEDVQDEEVLEDGEKDEEQDCSSSPVLSPTKQENSSADSDMLKEEEEDEIATPEKTGTLVAQKTPSQSSSATKRKFDALHARNSTTKQSISEHEKNKKVRASALMTSPATRVLEKKPAATRKIIKTKEFSFARPTASSARRTAAVATAHAQAKVTTTPLPARHVKSNKRTPINAHRASMSAAFKTPAKAARPSFGYTPYTGPLPPLTVESSFAPKNSQTLERGARTTSPARTKSNAAGRKKNVAPSNSTAGKENDGVNTNDGAATNATSSSNHFRTSVKSRAGTPVNKEKSRSTFKEKAKSQRSIAQEDARSAPGPTPVEPTA